MYFYFIDKPKKKISTRGTRGRAGDSTSDGLDVALVSREIVPLSHALGDSPSLKERVTGTGTEACLLLDDNILVPEGNSGL